jgi:ATP-dependent Clp protease adaptor protein ClpS
MNAFPEITPVVESDTEVENKLEQPYAALVYNDDVNSFDHVINCLMKICQHTFEQASQSALTIHNTGKCDVKRGSYEEMKLVVEKLTSKQLSAEVQEA